MLIFIAQMRQYPVRSIMGTGWEVEMHASGVLLLILSTLFNLSANLHSFAAQCIYVLDGDTIEVSRDGATIRVRLEGIDCPEKDEPFAPEAKAFTTKMAAGKTVIVVDKEQDTYGRTVARVYVDGRDLSVELLMAGLARHYKYFNPDWLLARLEQEAKADGVGMWAAPGNTSPAEKAVPAAPAVASKVAVSAGESSQIVYHGNTNSRVFHDPSCPSYNCKRCTRIFQSRDAAIAAGFKQCGICKP